MFFIRFNVLDDIRVPVNVPCGTHPKVGDGAGPTERSEGFWGRSRHCGSGIPAAGEDPGDRHKPGFRAGLEQTGPVVVAAEPRRASKGWLGRSTLDLTMILCTN